MHYNGPEPCWCGCQSEHVFVLEGLDRPLPREPLYFVCPSSGDALGFTAVRRHQKLTLWRHEN